MNLSSNLRTIRKRFDRQAGIYGQNPLTRWIGHCELAVLRDLIPPAPQPGTTTALDFGCGTGRASALLLERNYRVTGYDLSPAMLARARASLGSHPHAAFTSSRPAIKRQWPLIVALGILDYYPDPSPLWREWRKLLAADGHLVVTAPNARSPLAWLYAAGSRFTCPAYPATAQQLPATAHQAGLAVSGLYTAFPRQRAIGHTLILHLRPA
jgi:SAM-dependent methyltransferase